MMITGTHGSSDGVCGLSDTKYLNQDFYEEDCRLVGVKAGPRKSRDELPLSSWEDAPDITRPAEKLRSSEMTSDCYYLDEELKDMDIRLLNMSYYHGHGDKLLKDVEKECFIIMYSIN